MNAPLNVLAVMDADGRAVACVIDSCSPGTLREKQWARHALLHDAARAAVAELIEAAHAAKRAFLMGQPEVRGTDTVYPLDGALVGNALDSLRAALAACGGAK